MVLFHGETASPRPRTQTLPARFKLGKLPGAAGPPISITYGNPTTLAQHDHSVAIAAPGSNRPPRPWWRAAARAILAEWSFTQPARDTVTRSSRRGRLL